MHHDSTLRHGRWAFAQTANCAVRRRAFEDAGGFLEGVFMGEDADLCYRLRDAGWRMELRTRAAVVHRNRPGMRAMLRQLSIHGAANRWMQERWPGCTPKPRWPGLAFWTLRRFVHGVARSARGDRAEGAAEMLDPFAIWAFELGRLRPNRPRWHGPAAG
jgi:GT2 family glycosyltransferase